MTEKAGRSELVLRIVSGLILVATSLTLTVVSARSFAILILFFAVLMGWEWSKVVRKAGVDAIFVIQTCAVVIAGLITLNRHPAIASALIMLATWVVYMLHKRLLPSTDPWWSAAGMYYAGFPAIALIAIRQDADYGLAAIVYLFAIVWSTDTGAYFAGRGLGGPRLAPSVSPNKTWAGLAGGSALALIAGLSFSAWLNGSSAYALGLQSVALALVAQGGDLGESAIKRFFGVKNSSGLIPGHGGVLDRLDSLVFVAAGAGLIAAVRNPGRPGYSLLVW